MSSRAMAATIPSSNAGYGQLEINEHDPNGNPANVLRLGAGIAPGAVSVTSDGTSIFLTTGTAGDRIQLDGMFGNAQDGVQLVEFADGTVWTRQQVIANQIICTPGSDNLFGTTGPDIFDGRGGGDVEQGNGGNDVFIFNAGYGRLEINESDTNPAADNVLQLGAGIAPSAVTVTSDGSNLFLNIGTTGDRVQLDGAFANPQNGVQAVNFADGTVWTRQQLLALEMTGTPGSDILCGTTGPDVLDGKGGNDYAQGNGGNDTFIFNSGYGHLEINETNANPAADAVLQLGAGIAPSAVSVTSDGVNLFLNIGTSGDRVQLDGAFANPQNGVQAVNFADGTVWTRQQLLALEMTGTTGSDILYGTTGP